MPDAPPARPLSEWPAEDAGRILGVLTDIDDTLTTAGVLDGQARAALDALHAAGLPVIAITGRPLGFCLPFAQDWPVTAIVAENGAVAIFRDPRGGPEPVVEYAQDAATRAANASRLREVARQVLSEVPGSTLATDSAGRVTDIAVDHAEHARLAPEAIARVVQLMRAAGMNATVSSIHVNGWFGDHDKPSGARWMVRRLLGRELEAERERWVYVGDSTNDQAMFARFPSSVGVANLLDFAAQLETWPRWLASASRGAGFAQVAARLLEARR